MTPRHALGQAGSVSRLSPADKRRHHLLTSEQWVKAGVEQTFDYFSNAANLQALTPPFLHFSILTRLPIEMRTGTLIEYRLRLMRLPLYWLTRIEEWQPNEGFTDVQLQGPDALWIHRHTFTAHEGGTSVRDQVEYALPLAPLSDAVHALFVRPRLESIFA